MRNSVVVVVILLGLLLTAGAPPLPGPVVRGFDPPEQVWLAGHRGVDLAGTPGDPVVAPADGVVSYAGVLAGRPVLVVDHGDLRSTLEPVDAVVAVGARVSMGDVVGHLADGHACSTGTCLHWGLKRGDDYLDPWSMISSPVRLLPEGAATGVRTRAAARESARAFSDAAADVPATSGVLTRPSAGRLGSRFGPRFHPIFKQWRLHAGIDLSEPCGRPIVAAANGTVRHVGFDASGGWRLVIDHGPVDGVRLETIYLHAQGYRVGVGQQVTRGQLVGTVGTTGWSTGCHLHFSTKANGRHVDPLAWLG